MSDDLISRQAAIDALYSVDEYNSRSVKAIKQLPPIQPRRGKWIDTGSNEEWYAREYSCSECGDNMTDAISRQSVVDMLDETRRIAERNVDGAVLMTFERVLDSLVNITNALPTIQPAEPKRGKWILDRSGAYSCSECMEPCAGYVMMKPRDKFCKMCGSRNEVTE